MLPRILKHTKRSSNKPKISVVVPCYNQAHYLHGLLESVRLATSSPHEVIVVNDGSTRASTSRHLTALNPVAPQQSLVILETPNSGLPATRNTGIKGSEGEYIQLLDADDMLLPGSIDNRIALMEEKGAEVAISDYLFCNEERNTFWSPDTPTISAKNLSFHGVAYFWERGLTIPIHCGLFRRETILANLFHRKMKAKEDWIFWMGIFLGAKNVVHLEEAGCVYRMHNSNMTRDGRKMALSWIDAIEEASSLYPQFDERMRAEAVKHLTAFYFGYFWRKERAKFAQSFFDRLITGSE